MKTCLIFGGGGFLGSHLAEALVDKGYDVKVFDNFKNGMTNLNTIIDKIEIIKGDFFNESDVSGALKDVDYVFHYISTTTPATATKDPIYDIESNIIGSVKMFQWAVKNNVKKIIFPSSGGTIYGERVSAPCKETDPVNPVNPYAISKLTIENYLHYFNYAYGMDYTIFRYSNPYGERQNPFGKQGVIPIFLNKIKYGEKPLIYGDGFMVRDYIYIKDAIDATVAVLEKNTKEKVFNVGSGKGTSLNELIDIMSEVVDQKIIPKYVEKPSSYIPKIVLDISRMKREVGWEPTTDIQEGIQKTWKWINECF
jgi:UDP-glucose 4-epimerase